MDVATRALATGAVKMSVLKPRTAMMQPIFSTIATRCPAQEVDPYGHA